MKNKDSLKNCYTISTRVKDKQIIEEFRSQCSLYNKIFRYTYSYITRLQIDFDKNELNKHLQNKFNITKRIASSVVYDAKGRRESLVELTKYFIKQNKRKLDYFLDKRNKLKEIVQEKSLKVKDNLLNENQLKVYRNQKKDLFNLNQKINRYKMKIYRMEYNLDLSKLSICFGTKKLFNQQHTEYYKTHEGWLKAFRNKRDANAYYLGETEQLGCNQTFQLSKLENNLFHFKVRKIGEKGWIEGDCEIKHDIESKLKLLSNNLESHKQPITCRIHFEEKKCYIQIILTIEYDKDELKTNSKNGVIGLDFNEGFISKCITDVKGNLLDNKDIMRYNYGKGNKSKSELEKIAFDLVQEALKLGKSIVKEDLNFNKSKSKLNKSKTAKGKRYNSMLSTLDYSRFDFILNNIAHRNKVEIIKVNPAYTSKIAKLKYCKSKKLTVHQGAAYVIARRGQGFKDKIK